MNQPGKEMTPILARIAENQDFVKYLNESLQTQLMANVRLSGEECMRGQGRAQELIELIDFIETAPDIIKRNLNRDSRDKSAPNAWTA
jgi:hypothetical protein